MIRRIIVLVAVSALILAACSSGSDEQQTAQEAAVLASQANEQPKEQPATSYQAGESESTEKVADAEQATRDDSQDRERAEQPANAADQAGRLDSAEQTQATIGEQQATEQAVDTQTDDDSLQQAEPEQVAMIGQMIESGHRAGLFANRNSVGDPDAPIVITEYSDFL